MNSENNIGKYFLALSLLLLGGGLLWGILAGIYYVAPDYKGMVLPFATLRPLHVSSVMFWILIGATGCVYSGLSFYFDFNAWNNLTRLQGLLWGIAIGGIYYAYFKGDFGGREYWEFNPYWSIPIAIAWLLFLANFVKAVRGYSGRWPVYVWMWMTGIVFFIGSFTESYLWLFPYFREHFVTDMTIQWKANGALVGAWNQMLYGTAFFLMERISKNYQVGKSRLAFAMYFLGLFNLMFNWGHHIYTLPTDHFVRYTAYLVSMTEWVFFIKILYNWRQSVTEAQKHASIIPYRFLLAADVWVFLNLGQAILMSIPAINLYTHGTHVTVAHAMGTTIGINTMILFAACFEFIGAGEKVQLQRNKWVNGSFWTAQIALLVFWLSLNFAGLKKGIWQMNSDQIPFSKMMETLRVSFAFFLGSSVILATALFTLSILLLQLFVAGMRRAKDKKTPLSPS